MGDFVDHELLLSVASGIGRWVDGPAGAVYERDEDCLGKEKKKEVEFSLLLMSFDFDDAEKSFFGARFFFRALRSLCRASLPFHYSMSAIAIVGAAIDVAKLMNRSALFDGQRARHSFPLRPLPFVAHHRKFSALSVFFLFDLLLFFLLLLPFSLSLSLPFPFSPSPATRNPRSLFAPLPLTDTPPPLRKKSTNIFIKKKLQAASRTSSASSAATTLRQGPPPPRSRASTSAAPTSSHCCAATAAAAAETRARTTRRATTSASRGAPSRSRPLRSPPSSRCPPGPRAPRRSGSPKQTPPPRPPRPSRPRGPWGPPRSSPAGPSRGRQRAEATASEEAARGSPMRTPRRCSSSSRSAATSSPRP